MSKITVTTIAGHTSGSDANLVKIDGTASLTIPSGTTAQRPTAATGMIRNNTTDSVVEVYDGSNWVAVGDQVTKYDVEYVCVAGGGGGGSGSVGGEGGGGGAGIVLLFLDKHLVVVHLLKLP